MGINNPIAPVNKTIKQTSAIAGKATNLCNPNLVAIAPNGTSIVLVCPVDISVT